ncbi:hypothetical protein C1645_329586 [Glomus cerebriforme]|uniref:Serine-threonine/tyrosine-protein kinase catalytic domain-containing protein n=1 Tax=Glomus cerebriforme TaxID=658196 RepID=A0A397SKC0_9GLOM|nr:hypothetical protein C1645_329586 [Glomus cerebriforme]
MVHEEFLAIKICQGLRPRFSIKVPQVIDDIAKQCVDADPSKRPTAEYLFENFDEWWRHRQDSEIHKQIEEADEFNKKQPYLTKSSFNTEPLYTTHPQAVDPQAVDY